MSTGHENLRRLGLFVRQGLRVANVVGNRYLHRPPRYCPIVLMFLTDRCNLRCKMCGVCEHDPRTAGVPELTTDEWKGVIRSAVRLGAAMACMSGGEPLLRPDVFEIVRYAREQGLAVHMCTNGLLLDREAARRLGEAGVNTVSVSIESPVREIHEALRGAGTFDPAVASVRLLRESAPSIQVGINYLITTLNFRNMEAMIPFAESLDVQQLKFAPIHTNLLHRRKRIEQYGDLLFGEEDLEALDQEIRKLVRATGSSRLMTTSPMFLSKISAFYSHPARFRCYAGYAACAVNPTGVVSPCCDMDGALSVREMPLEAIWRSPRFQALRQQVRRCDSSCWDTTNAELSLRMTPSALASKLLQTWRDFEFYFGKKDQ